MIELSKLTAEHWDYLAKWLMNYKFILGLAVVAFIIAIGWIWTQWDAKKVKKKAKERTDQLEGIAKGLKLSFYPECDQSIIERLNQFHLLICYKDACLVAKKFKSQVPNKLNNLPLSMEKGVFCCMDYCYVVDNLVAFLRLHRTSL